MEREHEAQSEDEQSEAPRVAGPDARGALSTPAAVLALQRRIGNRAVARLSQDLPYVGAWASALNPLNHLSPRGRSLTKDEKDIVEPIYGSSLSTSVIRINENSIVSAGNCFRPTGNTINLPGSTIGRKSLIHECAHVWQHQNGVPAAYAVSALTSQLIAEVFQGDWRKAYDYSDMLKTPWRFWNAEQQAD
jgi:hypothetical protein